MNFYTKGACETILLFLLSGGQATIGDNVNGITNHPKNPQPQVSTRTNLDHLAVFAVF